MAYLDFDYQFGTSPRKIDPNYNKKTKVKKTNVKKQETNRQETKKNIPNKNIEKKEKIIQKPKKQMKAFAKVRIVANLGLIFGVVFSIIACQTLAEQKYKEKQNLQAEYNDLYAKMNSSQESTESVRNIASGYGMQTKTAKLINIKKSDYIESSQIVNSVITNENWFDKLINIIKEYL